MNELTEICGLSATQVGAAPAETLVDCTNVVQALLLPGAELALVIGFLVIGALVGLGVRHRARLSTAAIVGGVFESGLYAAAGAYFGSFGGLLYAELAGPTAMGVVMLAFALVAVAGVVLGLWHGDGGAGGKAGGVIVMLLFAGLFVGGAAAAFTVDDADSHALFLNLMALGFGTLAGFSALLVGLFRAMHPALGWLVIPVVSSWGLVGTTLGVLMHFGSWLFNADAGRRNTHADYAYNGLGMVVYDNGFRVKAGYAYTSGAVVTASSKKMIWHEAVHVLQHILFGSVFPVSYVVWAALLGLAGMIAGPIAASFSQGVFAWAYINNPWEVWEYKSSWHGVGSNPRQSYNMYTPGTAMVWSDGAALGIGITYMAVALGLWLLWMGLRLA
jgi:hypothetical protein